MKREYSRPDIIFEDFSLSTAISAGCGEKTNTPSQNICGLEFGPGAMVFTQQVSGCTIKVEDTDNNGLCYHVFCDESRLFNS